MKESPQNRNRRTGPGDDPHTGGQDLLEVNGAEMRGTGRLARRQGQRPGRVSGRDVNGGVKVGRVGGRLLSIGD